METGNVVDIFGVVVESLDKPISLFAELGRALLVDRDPTSMTRVLVDEEIGPVELQRIATVGRALTSKLALWRPERRATLSVVMRAKRQIAVIAVLAAGGCELNV